MILMEDQTGHTIPEGYSLEVQLDGPITSAQIISSSGVIAASGYAAETEAAFVYDRIVTSPEHRRRGLASALMTALRESRRNSDAAELLVATADGCQLYHSLGWQTLSLYTTGYIAEN